MRSAVQCAFCPLTPARTSVSTAFEGRGHLVPPTWTNRRAGWRRNGERHGRTRGLYNWSFPRTFARRAVHSPAHPCTKEFPLKYPPGARIHRPGRGKTIIYRRSRLQSSSHDPTKDRGCLSCWSSPQRRTPATPAASTISAGVHVRRRMGRASTPISRCLAAPGVSAWDEGVRKPPCSLSLVLWASPATGTNKTRWLCRAAAKRPHCNEPFVNRAGLAYRGSRLERRALLLCGSGAQNHSAHLPLRQRTYAWDQTPPVLAALASYRLEKRTARP